MKSILALFTLLALTAPALAAESDCKGSDKLCLMGQMETLAYTIENKSWRDQTFRELAKSYTHAGEPDKAIALIDKIENPDTKAMTIRGIGFAAADGKWSREKYQILFTKLAEQARRISHPPSQGIAWTYIAMAQAFAGDNAGATETARSMANEDLKNKAFAETSEIQAERGDYTAALGSIAEIKSASFRNKAYRTVSKILTDKGMTDAAYTAAQKIDNPYTKAQAIQTILNKGNPEEEGHEDKVVSEERETTP